jgi:hypothetical protein
MKVPAPVIAAIIEGASTRVNTHFTHDGVRPAVTTILETDQRGLHVNVIVSTINGMNVLGRLYQAWEIPHIRAPHSF